MALSSEFAPFVTKVKNHSRRNSQSPPNFIARSHIAVHGDWKPLGVAMIKVRRRVRRNPAVRARKLGLRAILWLGETGAEVEKSDARHVHLHDSSSWTIPVTAEAPRRPRTSPLGWCGFMRRLKRRPPLHWCDTAASRKWSLPKPRRVIEFWKTIRKLIRAMHEYKYIFNSKTIARRIPIS